MKARLLVLLALVFAPFSFANIYDGLDSIPVQVQEDTVYMCTDGYSSYEVGSQSACVNAIQTQIRDLNGHKPEFQFTDTNTNTLSSGAVQIQVKAIYCRNYCDTQNKQYQQITSNWFNFYEYTTNQIEVCELNGYVHKFDGACYLPIDLANNDTCPGTSQAPDIYTSSDSEPTSCVQLQDGSRCQVELVDTIGNYNTYQTVNTEETGACYYGDGTLATQQNNPSGTQCEELELDMYACPTNPDDVCSTVNGVYTCQSGCGDVNGVFVCITGDSDQDGIIDSEDDDCDGDGIPNNVDTDSPCSDNSGPPSDTGADLSATNTLIQQLIDSQNATTSKTTDVANGLGTVNNTLSDIKTTLNTPWSSENTPQTFDTNATALMQKTEDNALNAFNETASEAGVVFVQESDIDFITTMFGDLSASQCTDPVIWENYTWDLCSRAQDINDILYWILACVTMIAIFHRLYEIVKF